MDWRIVRALGWGMGSGGLFAESTHSGSTYLILAGVGIFIFGFSLTMLDIDRDE